MAGARQIRHYKECAIATFPFFRVSVICVGEPSNTEFSVRSAGRTLRSPSTTAMK